MSKTYKLDGYIISKTHEFIEIKGVVKNNKTGHILTISEGIFTKKDDAIKCITKIVNQL